MVILGGLEAFLEPLEAILAPLGVILGALGASWVILGRSWSVLSGIVLACLFVGFDCKTTAAAQHDATPCHREHVSEYSSISDPGREFVPGILSGSRYWNLSRSHSGGRQF